MFVKVVFMMKASPSAHRQLYSWWRHFYLWSERQLYFIRRGRPNRLISDIQSCTNTIHESGPVNTSSFHHFSLLLDCATDLSYTDRLTKWHENQSSINSTEIHICSFSKAVPYHQRNTLFFSFVLFFHYSRLLCRLVFSFLREKLIF